MTITKDGITLKDGTSYTLEYLTTEINKLKISEEDIVLLQIEWTGGRNWDGAYEYIPLPKDRAVAVKDMLIGSTVYFGEIAGKHSDIYGELEESDFTIVTDKDKVNQFLKNFNGNSDYNHSFINTLIDYVDEADEGEYDYTSDELAKLVYGDNK